MELHIKKLITGDKIVIASKLKERDSHHFTKFIHLPKFTISTNCLGVAVQYITHHKDFIAPYTYMRNSIILLTIALDRYTVHDPIVNHQLITSIVL